MNQLISSSIETWSIVAGRAVSALPPCCVRAATRPEHWRADSPLGKRRGILLRLVRRRERGQRFV